MAITIGRFGLSLKEAERLTWHDYCIYDLAYQVKMQEKETLLAKQAWFNQAQKRQKGAVKISNQRMKTSMIFIMLRKRSLLFLGFLNKQKDCLLLT